MFHRRYRRHERFAPNVAASPCAQVQQERLRVAERDFILDCLDLIEGRRTPGADRAEAERVRLLKLASEAKRRALVGADPLNITKHSKTKPKRQVTAAPPVEHVGMIVRTITSLNRLSGKNKLNRRQVLAADTYRDAFETMHASLGGAMDFSRVRASSGGQAVSEAALIASQTLTQANKIIGDRATIIIEQVVCHGHTVSDCTRRLYGYDDGKTPASRDVNHVGRMLREALNDLGDLWHPDSSYRKMRVLRPEKPSAGAAGVHTITSAPYVTR